MAKRGPGVISRAKAPELPDAADAEIAREESEGAARDGVVARKEIDNARPLLERVIGRGLDARSVFVFVLVLVIVGFIGTNMLRSTDPEMQRSSMEILKTAVFIGIGYLVGHTTGK